MHMELDTLTLLFKIWVSSTRCRMLLSKGTQISQGSPVPCNRDAVVGSLSYIGGRLTAPVSGDEGTDAELADKAKAKTRSAADAVSSGAQQAQDKTAQAAEDTKQQAKGLFSSIRDAFSQPADHRDSTMERAHHDAATLGDKAKSAIGDAQDKCVPELLTSACKPMLARLTWMVCWM